MRLGLRDQQERKDQRGRRDKLVSLVLQELKNKLASPVPQERKDLPDLQEHKDKLASPVPQERKDKQVLLERKDKRETLVQPERKGKRELLELLVRKG